MMIEITAPATGAVTATVLSTQNYERFYLLAPLGAAETVTVSQAGIDATGPIGLPDVNGVLGGLSNATQARVYFGGPDLVLVKSVTAAAVGIYLIPVGKAA